MELVSDGSSCDRSCRQFKRKEQQKEAEKAGDGDGDGRWGLLVKKVKAVRVMASLGKRRSPTQC